MMSSIPYDLKKIKAFLFDVDGVLSREVISLDASGEPMRTVSTKDGYAIHQAVRLGFAVGIITGGNTENVRTRYAGLGAQYIYLKSAVKMDDLRDFLSKTHFSLEELAYAGDDIPDYDIMSCVGLPVAPADAVPEIKALAKYISPRRGGEGVARDLIEQTLKAQGRWMNDKEAFGW
jgi:3-deoxy-D-manno-octulosonate 8-phosphate phosphatase (KDO 8-P phosphatase)